MTGFHGVFVQFGVFGVVVAFTVKSKITKRATQGCEALANSALDGSLWLSQCFGNFGVGAATEVRERNDLAFAFGEFTERLLHTIGHGQIPNFTIKI